MTRVVFVGVLALVLATSGTATHSVGRVARRESCPNVIPVGAQGIGTTLEIIRAVRRGVPRIFRDLTTQGEARAGINTKLRVSSR